MSPPTAILHAPNGREIVIQTGLFINNEWVDASNGQKMESINPAYVQCTRLQVNVAVTGLS